MTEDEKLIRRIDEHGVGLTDWEIQFVASCLERLERGATLTDAQRSAANRIDEQRVS